jgi:hypothetical protein
MCYGGSRLGNSLLVYWYCDQQHWGGSGLNLILEPGYFDSDFISYSRKMLR